MEIIGSAKFCITKTANFAKIDTDIYFFEDVEKFEKADLRSRERQRVDRFVSNTIYFNSGRDVLHLTFWEEHKSTKEKLAEYFGEQDEKLTAIVSLMERADASDAELFFDVESVQEYSELKELGSDLKNGLGFNGNGFGFIVCTVNHSHYGIMKKVFIEKVMSYMEGYSVQHQELTPELFALARLDKVSEELWRLK